MRKCLSFIWSCVRWLGRSKRKRRDDIFKYPVTHSQQPHGTGCMYHSFVALTGERQLLTYCNDNSPERFLIRVSAAGYLLFPVYCDGYRLDQGASFWLQHINQCASKGAKELRFLATCLGLGVRPRPGAGPSVHVIGVRIEFPNQVTVADPMQPILQPPQSIAAFLRTDYAIKTVEVLRVDSGVLADYPPVPPTAP